MPDRNNCRNNKFSRYIPMSDLELESLLQLDAQKSAGTETEEILYITELLAQRRRGQIPEAQEAYRSFQRNYDPRKEPAQEGGTPVPESPAASVHRKLPVWARRIIGTAAALALVVGTAAACRAFGFDILGRAAQWTQDVFGFGSLDQGSLPEADPERSAEDGKVVQALRSCNMDPALYPRWVPEGFSLNNVRTSENPVWTSVRASYMCGEREFTVSIVRNSELDASTGQFEKDNTQVEVYEHGGVSYYIFADRESQKAAWSVELYVCSISGDLAQDELKKMIDSIE